MQKYPNTSLYANCSLCVYDCGRRPSVASQAAKSCVGASYMSRSVVAGANTRHASSECDPLHERRRRWHLEGGNGRVASTQRESCGGFGSDLVPKCSYGLTYHNRVERSIGQSPSSESQRVRSPGQLLQGFGGTGALGGSNAMGASPGALIHALRCGGMSEEVTSGSGVWPPSRTTMTRYSKHSAVTGRREYY